jgi:hypothetical protein
MTLVASPASKPVETSHDTTMPRPPHLRAADDNAGSGVAGDQILRIPAETDHGSALKPITIPV